MLFNKLNKSKGIGLLELMLALVIISIILVMGTRFFQVARQSDRVNSTLSTIKVIYSAAQNWHDRGTSFKEEAYPGAGGDQALLKKFVENNLLPNEFESGSKPNPWGGNFTVPDTSITDNAFTITISDIPPKACHDLKNKLSSKQASEMDVKKIDGKCSGALNSLKLDFNFEEN